MAEERPFLQVSCRSTFIMVSIHQGQLLRQKRHIIYFNNDIYLLIISINDESNFPVSLYICKNCIYPVYYIWQIYWVESLVYRRILSFDSFFLPCREEKSNCQIFGKILPKNLWQSSWAVKKSLILLETTTPLPANVQSQVSHQICIKVANTGGLLW